MLQKKITTAYWIPFMSVAGDHAKNDMAGDEEDSWTSIFTKAGIKCIPILKGTADTNRRKPRAWNLELGVGRLEDLEVAIRYAPTGNSILNGFN